ncbi:hypothetical protein SAMN05445871_4166 [Paraburkholderia caballeronis]|uniref:Uncharacterized protein n=2 Tax=Paraburkholderia caballeronis TaxID=416943 RepID=A0A1H7KQN3_9BURK|nr:hypothetical protein C7403_10213 [Paraburkholderia caballeronis]PXX03488.1 hypothetical protein C7407_10213 [Paraburkholderia caballeronis]RAK04232.1 hypothetical protein C7409_10213 [Paraburkholderia caballeronis]SED88418.1 hypothetical protein SAMN05445871_4166 [Paraburkholderia caballeronis]SEK89048.1 hypothetical protein SAMN05192542_10413 [Paraburkholderia caballeronis]
MPMIWNTLDVPLQNGWQCTLIPGPQYGDMMRRGYGDMATRALYPNAGYNRWRSSSWNAREPDEAEKRRLWEEDARRQLDEDRRTFIGYFRLDWDLRTITGNRALDDICAFLREHQYLWRYDQPDDNDSIRRVLCEAVRRETLIPVVNREYRGLPRVSRPTPGPLNGSGTGGSGSYAVQEKVLTLAEFQALQRANGELGAVASSTRRVGLGAILDPLPALGAAASGGAMTKADSLVEDALGSSTPLGNAQTFEYVPDSLADVTEELAASTGNPDYAAKMLGYDRKTFSAILHVFKPANGLGPSDNVIWHDNGDVYFKGSYIGNFHDWAD